MENDFLDTSVCMQVATVWHHLSSASVLFVNISLLCLSRSRFSRTTSKPFQAIQSYSESKLKASNFHHFHLRSPQCWVPPWSRPTQRGMPQPSCSSLILAVTIQCVDVRSRQTCRIVLTTKTKCVSSLPISYSIVSKVFLNVIEGLF